MKYCSTSPLLCVLNFKMFIIPEIFIELKNSKHVNSHENIYISKVNNKYKFMK